jgi:hypothetical protein
MKEWGEGMGKREEQRLSRCSFSLAKSSQVKASEGHVGPREMGTSYDSALAT